MTISIAAAIVSSLLLLNLLRSPPSVGSFVLRFPPTNPVVAVAVVERNSRFPGRCREPKRLHLGEVEDGGEISNIDFQSDGRRYGRGDMHLSADLSEDGSEVVVYQAGQWEVDGVVVGDDTEPPTYRYARVESIQLVWTHNCEHGVIRGAPMVLVEQEDMEEGSAFGDGKSQVLVEDPAYSDYELVEFGPEQLVARLPVRWQSEDGEDEEGRRKCVLLARVSDSLWREEEGKGTGEE